MPEKDPLAARIEDALSQAGLPPLSTDALSTLAGYVSLFVRWNGRTNLSAIRDEDGIIRRHMIESIALNNALPARLSTLLDFGSGGGLPGIPIAICRPELHVTLAESQNKKAAFLREAVRVLELNAAVHAGRAEDLPSLYDCVTLRAVDNMSAAVTAAAHLVAPNGTLALMTTRDQFPSLQAAAGPAFLWDTPLPLPNSRDAILALGRLSG